MYKADYHMHTNFSDDSQALMEDQIKRAIALGFDEIVITDHNESYPEEVEYVLPVDIEEYIHQFNTMKSKYGHKINLKLGMEIGYEARGKEVLRNFVNQHPFDFIICSLHSLEGEDFYFGTYFKGKTKKEAFTKYFQAVNQCIHEFKEFNVFGHLDYINRYWPFEDKDLNYLDYKDIIDTILKNLIHNEKGIELNTSGIRYKLGHMHPQVEILERYRELGGEIITIGSDSHRPEDVGAYHHDAREILKDVGFKYFTTFTKRKPEFKVL